MFGKGRGWEGRGGRGGGVFECDGGRTAVINPTGGDNGFGSKARMMSVNALCIQCVYIVVHIDNKKSCMDSIKVI